MTLQEWLEAPRPDGSRKVRGEFARAIGVTPQMISAYCKGDSFPSPRTLAQIAEQTEGAVTANDFLDHFSIAPVSAAAPSASEPA